MNENLSKLINDYVDGLVTTGGQTLDQLEYGVENAMYDYVDRYIENEEGEEIENPEFEKSVKFVYESIKNNDRLYVWSADIYAHDGIIKTLNEAYICSNEYESPFDDISKS